MVFISRPVVSSNTHFDIPLLADHRKIADGKFSAEKWTNASMAEMWSWPGIESITGVGGEELIKQAGLDTRSASGRGELFPIVAKEVSVTGQY